MTEATSSPLPERPRASLADYHYELPEALIAQHPAPERAASRLMVLDRARGTIAHRRFAELPELLTPGDLLVLNDTRVLPTRVFARKDSGGRVELLFFGPPEERPGGWACRALARSSKPLREGARLAPEHRGPAPAGAGASPALTVERVASGGEVLVAAASGPPPSAAWAELLHTWGEVPLPPYIRRGAEGPDAVDAERYQTVYARVPGAVAAPTAGLHFTPALFERLAAGGVAETRVTLHVGPGTFQPVRDDDYTAHQMLAEWYEVPAAAAAAITAHRPPRGRVVAVGTTTVRAMEWAAREDGVVRPGAGETRLFVTPGYTFRTVDALVTNFHLPGSTLLLLVAAFAGRDLLLEAYRRAVAERYRFYSYGDAMLIL